MLDLLVIGGGVMGLFTAYHASAALRPRRRARTRHDRRPAHRVLRAHPLLPHATTSTRCTRAWPTRRSRCGPSSSARPARDVLVRCGCMNIASAAVTPDLAQHLRPAEHRTCCTGSACRSRSCDRDELERDSLTWTRIWRHLDETGGLVDLRRGDRRAARATLAERKVAVHERVETTAIDADGDAACACTPTPVTSSPRSVVITAGHGTNDVLARLAGCDAAGPADQGPAERGEVLRAAGRRSAHRFTSDAMPVIAYLDTGVYVHPIVDGVIDAVKIGYYNPPDIPRGRTGVDDIADFVDAVPARPARAPTSATCSTSTSATTTWSPTTTSCSARCPASPTSSSASAGAAPATSSRRGSAACCSSSRCSDGTVYDIGRFDPARFADRSVSMNRPSARTFEQRLADGVVVGAEGYVFELERRGYVKAGPYVPEVILDAPDALRQLHREFLRAGADVMVALTYYAHREKLRDVGRDGDLEEMNRQAVRIANEIAAEGGALVAGNICNTWCYDPADPQTSGEVVREQYREQLGWAKEEGVDFVISETNDYLGEALIGLEVCQELGLPAMVTLASVQPDATYDGTDYVEACRILAGARRGGRRAELLARAGDDAAAARAHPRRRRHPGRGAAGPVPHRRRDAGVRVADRAGRAAAVPDPARGHGAHPVRDGRLRARGGRARRRLHRHLLRRRAALRPRDGRGARARDAGQPVLAGARAASGARRRRRARSSSARWATGQPPADRAAHNSFRDTQQTAGVRIDRVCRIRFDNGGVTVRGPTLPRTRAPAGRVFVLRMIDLPLET